MNEELKTQVREILKTYDNTRPEVTSGALRQLWLQFEPKSMGGIKEEERARQETVGTPVPVLKVIGDEVARPSGKNVDRFLPLALLLWETCGREGRVIAAIVLGKMELADPERIFPLLRPLGQTCHTWEDADRLAMDAVEPIVRKYPDMWLPRLETWLADESKWVRRIAVTVAGRLPMKKPDYTTRSLAIAEILLLDQEEVVKKAVSFAIRLCARGQVEPVVRFLDTHVPPENPAATWVLCDAIRSMATSLLPEFAPLLPNYASWAADPNLGAADRRSVESAVKMLERVGK